tara:strand:- start:359 stop:565 length:207 start_codon:yes stop_codon:yes gene_type:complete
MGQDEMTPQSRIVLSVSKHANLAREMLFHAANAALILAGSTSLTENADSSSPLPYESRDLDNDGFPRW